VKAFCNDKVTHTFVFPSLETGPAQSGCQLHMGFFPSPVAGDLMSWTPRSGVSKNPCPGVRCAFPTRSNITESSSV
jgi:hypothetical protein